MILAGVKLLVSKPIDAIKSPSSVAFLCPCDAAMLDHIRAHTKSRGTPCPCPYLKPRLYWASASPCSAARLNHFADSSWSCRTPSPFLYIRPRLNWAEGFPCSARGVHSRREVTKSPFRAASKPLPRSALHPSAALNRRRVRARHAQAIRYSERIYVFSQHGAAKERQH